VTTGVPPTAHGEEREADLDQVSAGGDTHLHAHCGRATTMGGERDR
jgi:hypothetical protein